MALNQRRGAYQRPRQTIEEPPVSEQPVVTDAQITGTWSSPDTDSSPDDMFVEDEVSEPLVEPAVVDDRPKPLFVRVVHGQVGMYPQGSVVAAATFEYLPNLLALGAVEYDEHATAQSITGNPEHLATVSGVLSAAMQTIPTAPWASAAPHNLLGAHYVSLVQARHQWTPTPGPEPVATIQIAEPIA